MRSPFRRRPAPRSFQGQLDRLREEHAAELQRLRTDLADALDKIQLMEGADVEHRDAIRKAFGT